MKKVKSFKKFGIARFLVMALVLGGGLVYGTQMVQKNQDNRSKATDVSSGSCFVSEGINSNVTDGSLVCVNTGLGELHTVSKCVGGQLVKQGDCGLTVGCVYVSKTDMGNGILKTDAACRNDDRCTKVKKGTCTASLSANNGDSCLTNGENGKVEGNLCFSDLTENGKKCCVPNGESSGVTSSDCYLGTLNGYKVYVKNGFSSCTTSGSIAVGSGSVAVPWISTDKLVKCSNGKTTTTDCLTSVQDKCVYTSNRSNMKVTKTGADKTIVVSGVTARCGSDSDCTSKGGTCNISMSGSVVGKACSTTNGTSGIITSGLCWSVINGNNSLNKYCCVPNSSTVSTTKINGACGSSKNTCTKGTLNDTTDSSTYYKWQCVGSNGGTTASCTKKKMVNGVCGKSDRQNVTKKPTSGLCSSGTSTIVYYKSSSKYWYWSCKGSNGGTTASCKAYNRGGGGGQM
ncbi:MAG: hypothetical protein PHX34_02030 [Candidatus Shapirobacteria bacterium]|nr:hypothetical protein [Candidatus Shapirobacteria bacterium]